MVVVEWDWDQEGKAIIIWLGWRQEQLNYYS
jgi:hypothetical protein